MLVASASCGGTDTIEIQVISRRSAHIVLLAVKTTFIAANAACGGGSDGQDITPIVYPTPIDFETPPIPTADGSSISEFLSQCDAAVIRAARAEAELREAIFACETPLQWAGAVTRYPAALGSDAGTGSIFSKLSDICFRTTDAEFKVSKLCQATIGDRTVTPQDVTDLSP